MSLSSSQRAPPSPPDSLSSSPKSRTNNNSSSCISPRVSLSRPSSSLSTSASLQSLHKSVPTSSLQHTFSTTLSPGLDAAISTRLPSSPSSRSASSYHSPSVSPNPVAASYRAIRRDQDADDTSFELGSEFSSGDVAEAQGLMRSLGLDISLEEGEIPEDVSREMVSSDPAVSMSSMSLPPVLDAAVLSPSASISRSLRSHRERTQRVREDSEHGGAIPSSPEVMPSLSNAYSNKDTNNIHDNRHGSAMLSNSLSSSNSTTPMGNVTPVPALNLSTSHLTSGSPIDATSATSNVAPSSSVDTGISSLPSSSTTSSSLSSSNTFHTASSSASIPTSISASGSSVVDISLCGAMTQQPTTTAQKIVVSESGTIQLPPPASVVSNTHAAATNGSSLNPNAAEHIPAAFSPNPNDIDVAAAGDSSIVKIDLQHKTANVYINGLPPHCPEDQLFELAAPFGAIRSVRTFTRHIGEKESGYGFVLFESVESAEKCILALREFRNLHPTFSKQAHKIPGIPYTGPSPTHEQDDDEADVGHSQYTGATAGNAPDAAEALTFKTKMERLSDPTSTNLYIEGLPLSIDEPSLAALVSPHRIKSSRFFQTRLSNPPRIIAFVRLETRVGAEEVIERLHGRMVRGWNDPGSRISVRFADTNEQRELRRQERTGRGDESSSPSRLTIAQAALLNLRGRDQYRVQPVQVIGNRNGRGAAYGSGATTANQGYHDFSSNAHDMAAVAGSYHSGGALEYPFNSIPSSSSRRGLAQTAPYDQPISLPPPASANFQNSQNIDPAMAAILGTLRRNGVPFETDADHYDDLLQLGDYRYRQQQLRNGLQVLGEVDMNLGYSNQFQRLGGGVAQARGGYTPAEEFILQTHAASNGASGRRVHSSQTQPQFCADGPADFNVGVRGYRTQASTISVPQSQQQGSYYTGHGNGALPAVLEDEGQPTSVPQPPLTYTRSQILSIGNRMGITGSNPTRGYRGDRETSSSGQLPSQQQSNSLSQFSSNRTLNDHNHSQQVHVRSTTHPNSSTTSSSANQRHSQHNSMSIPKPRNIITDIMRTTTNTLKPRSNNSISANDNLKSNIANGIYNNPNDTTDGAPTYTGEVANNLSNGTIHYHQHHHNYKPNLDLYTQPLRHQARQLSQEFHQHQKSFRGDVHGVDTYDGTESGSPPLVSPALTYSSRGSAGTLSPSTPFVGSFAQATGGGTGFQGSGIESEA
ncbi:rcop c3 [Moniliophthora roreri]|nr:rcop c3 [Moniliophthora roreri]